MSASPRIRAAPKQRPPASKRLEVRNALWPGAEKMIWSRKENDGFTTVPRLLPLVMALIRELSPRGNPALVYLDFWARAFDEATVKVANEAELAYSSGYTGQRAVRTWRDHVLKLQELGFISVKPNGNSEIGHVLLLNPLTVCAKLRSMSDRVPDEWWSAFVQRASEIGAKIPEQAG